MFESYAVEVFTEVNNPRTIFSGSVWNPSVKVRGCIYAIPDSLHDRLLDNEMKPPDYKVVELHPISSLLRCHSETAGKSVQPIDIVSKDLKFLGIAPGAGYIQRFTSALNFE